MVAISTDSAVKPQRQTINKATTGMIDPRRRVRRFVVTVRLLEMAAANVEPADQLLASERTKTTDLSPIEPTIGPLTPELLA